MTWTYRLHGLNVASDFVLPARQCAIENVDVSFRFGGVVPTTERPPAGEVLSEAANDHSMSIAVRSDDGLVYWLPGMATFSRRAGSDKWLVTAHDERSVEYLPVLIVGGVFALTLLELGRIPLHASAVQLPGEDGFTAVLAPSNGGKTTIAAVLCARGATLASDDLYCIDPITFDGFRGTSSLRVRPDALSVDTLFGSIERSTTIDGRIAVSPRPTELDRAPVKRILVPRLVREASSPPSLSIGWAQVWLLLLGNLRLPGITSVHMHSRLMDQLSLLAEHVPIELLEIVMSDGERLGDGNWSGQLLSRSVDG